MKRFIRFLILIIFLIFAYAKFIEPTNLKINEYLITNSKIPSSFDGTKIIHFSDVLYEDEKDYTLFAKAIKQIQDSKPDIIIFTGDLIKNKINDQTQEKLTILLNDLKPSLYKYAILGDNDDDTVKTILETSNFIILENSSEYLFNEGPEPILIAGGNNLTNESNLNDENITYNYKIAITHTPDNFDNLKKNYDLVLAGHSLGGEIRIPFIGALIKKDGAQKYTDATYHKDETNMYVSFGMGIEKTGLRLFNKPSINIYRIYSK